MRKIALNAIIVALFTLLVKSTPAQSMRAAQITQNNWSSLGSIPVNGQVRSIAISGAGDVYVASDFSAGLGWPRSDQIAKWDGTSWSFLGTKSLNGTVVAIAIGELNEVYAGGFFTNAGDNPNADYIAKWNGSSWTPLGTTPLSGHVYSIAVDGNDVYAGGVFLNAGGNPNADRFAKWDGSSWSAVGGPFSANVFSIIIDETNGDVYAGGAFTNAGGNPDADYIAKWDGTSWLSLGITPLNSSVWAVAISGTGDIYAGGNFTNAGGDPNADYIAKWDGTSWSALGNTPRTPNNYSLYGHSITIRGTDVYAGFASGGGNESAMFVAKWDGSAWSDPAASQLTYDVYSLAIDDAFLYAGGSFKDAGGNPNADYITRVELPISSSALVTNTNDSGAGSLRYAIENSNPGDIITFTPSLSGQTIITSGLDINHNITIDGSSLSDHVKISGEHTNPVISIPMVYISSITIKGIDIINGMGGGLRNYSYAGTGVASITIDDVSFESNQNPDFWGGAIYNNGNMTITNSVFFNNSGERGGAIFNSGTLFIIDSDIYNNTSENWGGGIYNQNIMTISRANIYSNYAEWSGDGIYTIAGTDISNTTIKESAIYNNLGHGVFFEGSSVIGNTNDILTIANSTISGNTGKGVVTEYGSVVIKNSTISNNTQPVGWAGASGIHIFGDAFGSTGTLTLLNSIVANNTNGIDCDLDNSDLIESNGNLIENNGVGNGSCGNPFSSSDPMLGPLQNNGGITQTMALLPGSPAINAGDDAACDALPVGGIDQRGIARPQGSHCDIGAFEYQDTIPPLITSISRVSGSPTSSASVDFTVTFSEDVIGVSTSTPFEDFQLSTSGVSSAAITDVSGSGSVYTVTVNTGSGNGTIRLDVPVSADILDISGNPLSNLPYTGDESYLINKTLRGILYSNGSQDGWVLESSETSESGGAVDATSTVLMVGDDASDRQYRSMLSFDTSSLPDTAVITQAVLSLRINEILGGGNPIKTFNYFTADVMSGSFGSSSSLAAQDFGFSPTVTAGPLGVLNRGGWYYVDLKTGRSAVNTIGLTQVRLRFTIPDNDNAIENIVKIYSGNSAVPPQLSLWYYVP